MDDTSQTLTTATANHRFNDDIDGDDAAEDDDDDDDDDELCDTEAWEILTKSFKEVQSVLDRNRRLIQQVNENHRSKIPQNMAKNVDLIREINANISNVIGLYSNLSADFSNIVHQRRAVADKPVNKIES